MACPYFYPVELLSGGSARSPLGGECQGTCRADSSEAFQPDGGTMQSFCNFGYARGLCPRFPESSPFDAVRFSVRRDGDGARIVFVLERDYAPLRHGVVRYLDGRLEGELPDECVARQAAVFASAYDRLRAPCTCT